MSELKIDEDAWEQRKEEYRTGKRCGACGLLKVAIRGRFPRDPERLVCATCLAERMDQIREISDPSYGIPQQANP